MTGIRSLSGVPLLAGCLSQSPSLIEEDTCLGPLCSSEAVQSPWTQSCCEWPLVSKFSPRDGA